MTRSHTEQLPILIAGGGIGGAAAAIALARTGRKVEVFEQAPEMREIGAGIQMPPNAFRAFAALGVLEPMQEVAAYPESLVLGDITTGKSIYRVPIGEEFVRRFGFRYALLHRGDILERLVSACKGYDEITLRPGCRVSGFRDVGDRVVVELADGTSAEGAGLIGGDGLWSVTREALVGDQPTTDGYILCRGIVPVSEISEALYSNSVTMWGGPGIDFFHYPIRSDQVFNIGASYRDSNIKAGSNYPVGAREAFNHQFRDACAHVKNLLEHVSMSRAWVLHHRPPIATWTKGRVTLLGDAAHPTYIYISQGACMALEDAVVLGEMVSQHDDIRDAFRAYDKARYLRTARIQLTSQQFGDIYHAGGVHRELRNALLARTKPQALYDTLGWVFGGSFQEPSMAHPGID
ncbi:FAD-dependent monooxygenase [Xanthobacter tagetidis]|nr:FAD-dependent monooxygenase [Xanthobacter tagetidis]MBB6309097.1 salicylate hydroxylase [Xanthobacter tagetidis]